MMPAGSMAAAVVALAAGTYALRCAGPALRDRVELPHWLTRRITMATVVLLAALVATQALVDGEGFAGWARPAGVLAGGVLAWLKAPFLVVVLAGAAVAAALRMVGVP
ncbi:AzlD domain-containing protein [Haloechinothrix sp. YIM 98757]|uniref:AzlD domain-containing protein n=1 Tax=Haloechinothrix aidingensis TaxID=2752311 RepID=A0A838AA76_9PSEU|nr:AzlD domain-containing protein [Haloechinothrix aidingensis]MBA0126032.1 AzlD domain-containing protein [Haloechinothrix aidingensis]